MCLSSDLSRSQGNEFINATQERKVVDNVNLIFDNKDIYEECSHRKEDGETHDEESGKAGVVDDVEDGNLH